MKKSILIFALIMVVISPISAKADAPAAPKATSTPTKKAIAKTAKMLTVNVSELYEKYGKAAEARAKFDEAAQEAQNKINDMMREGMALGEQYKDLIAKSNNPALTEEARKKFLDEASNKAKEIEQKQAEINRYQQEALQILTQRKQSVMNLHMNDMQEVCAKIAKEKGADIVLNTTAAVMYASPDMNITEEAIYEINVMK